MSLATEGTITVGKDDLPPRVHEFSDRLLVVASGVGLFHYLPDAGKSRELRSVVVDTGDAVLFTRGVVHTFTAPLQDLTLLSFHAPFIESQRYAAIQGLSAKLAIRNGVAVSNCGCALPGVDVVGTLLSVTLSPMGLRIRCSR